MFRSPVKYATCLCSLSVLLAAAGCTTPSLFYQPPPPPEMLGTKVDQLNQIQEENAEASKFVIYQHEFELNKNQGRRNGGGDSPERVRRRSRQADRRKRAQRRLRTRSSSNAARPVLKAGTKYKYPVHFNPDLDMKRREVVVRALTRMGIADADTRVVVAPAFAQPLTGNEAQGAYAAGISGWGGGMGGGMGGMGGGMGGGFGGGWF